MACPAGGVTAVGALGSIVVGVDESDGAAAALRWAVREGDLHDAKVTAVMAWGFLDQHHGSMAEGFDPSYSGDDALAALRGFITAAVPDEAARVGAQVVCDLPARALVDAAANADLLVVGARGMGGFRGLLLGSVSQHCLHHNTTPTAIVREAGDPGAQPRGRIVVGVDGSDTAGRALRWAIEEAQTRDAPLEVVNAWQVPYVGYYPHTTAMFAPAVYEEASKQVIDNALEAAALAGTPVEVTRTSVRGGASAAILDAANGAELLVLGSRGLGGLKGLLLGSVTAQAAQHARCSIVVVPPAPPQ